jgi:hypothetical protein
MASGTTSVSTTKALSSLLVVRCASAAVPQQHHTAAVSSHIPFLFIFFKFLVCILQSYGKFP